MSTPAEVRLARRVLRHELEAIRAHWVWFLALGIILIIVGTIAVGMPIVSSFASAVAFGSLLLLGGVAQLVGAFWTRDWSGFFLSLLMGVLYVAVPVLCADGGRALPDPWFGNVPVPALGLDACRWHHQLGPRHHDLAAMARIEPSRDRPLRGNRPDLHWLDMGDAGLVGEEAWATDNDESRGVGEWPRLKLTGDWDKAEAA
jgi:Short repeat of unknown function (DUF308)